MKIQDIIDKFDTRYFLGNKEVTKEIKDYLQSSLTSLLDSLEKEYRDKFQITDHLQCGNKECMYDGEWCYHFTDKDFGEVINIINSHR